MFSLFVRIKNFFVFPRVKVETGGWIKRELEEVKKLGQNLIVMQLGK